MKTTDYLVYGGLAALVLGAGFFTFTQVKKLKAREQEIKDVLKSTEIEKEVAFCMANAAPQTTETEMFN